MTWLARRRWRVACAGRRLGHRCGSHLTSHKASRVSRPALLGRNSTVGAVSVAHRAWNRATIPRGHVGDTAKKHIKDG